MNFIEAKEIFRDADSRKGLPAWTYNNDELTRLEMEQVFLRNWIPPNSVPAPRHGHTRLRQSERLFQRLHKISLPRALPIHQ